MTYNELAQVLETKNPQTGQALQALRPERLQDVEPAVGTGMLEDNVFVRGDWLKDPTNQDTP